MVLTPNQRLSKIAQQRYDQEKLTEHKTAWASLQAMPFQSFALNLSQTLMKKTLLPPRLLLNAHQIDVIWQNLINHSTDSDSLAHFSSAAIKAWQLSHEWGVNIQSSDFLQTDVTAIWQQWAIRFQEWMQENQWIDSQTLLHQVVIYLKKTRNLSFLPPKIILLGFTDFTPFEQNFLTVLRNNHQVIITEMDFSITPDFSAKKSFHDEEAEFEAMAQWAYEQSQIGSVACVIPQLASVKDKVAAVFGRYVENKTLINISLGNNLCGYPLIRAAITGLKLLEENLSIETISDFLLSPFYQKSFSDISNRSILDVKLKSQLQPVTNKNNLFNILGNHKIKVFFEKTINTQITKTYREWVELFQEHLNFLGWPGERVLSSEEFQLMAHWDTLLENVASLSIVTEKITFQKALRKLTAVAHQSLFQPKRSPEAKIDILGTLEAAGLPFDFMWLAGMQENAWPSKGMPNPFLPLFLQRKLNMPHSSSEQNFNFCERITKQLLSSANKIMVTYPNVYQDNPVRPSVFIQAVADIEENIILPIFPKIAEKSKKLTTINCEIIEDHQAPPLNTENSKHYGSEIFKDQAACPFRAYAKHRLKAKKIELPQLGFKAITRGNLVHKILEDFFKFINNHQKLCETADWDIAVTINNSIHQVLDKDQHNHKNIFSIVEKKRLEQLLLSWIEKEKCREPFTVIATEETLKVHFGKIPLHLRIDRIDKIGEDQYFIIDYKTGKINFNSHHPMDEPQLPLYCVVSSLDVDSIAFAQLRMGDAKLKTFPQQKSIWEKSLLEIADDFIQGNALVKPKYGQETCRYCDLSSLCRIKEKLNMS